MTNEYCRQCGAVLSVATSAVQAQQRPVMPAFRGIRWRWVGAGAFVILGCVAVLLGVLLGISFLVIGTLEAGQLRDLGELFGELAGLGVALIAVFLLAFGLGGTAISWLARRSLVFETLLGAAMVLLLLAVVGSAVTGDALLLMGVLAVPAGALAGLGGRLGEVIGSSRGDDEVQ